MIFYLTKSLNEVIMKYTINLPPVDLKAFAGLPKEQSESAIGGQQQQISRAYLLLDAVELSNRIKGES
jgi:hypothetical protein